MKATIVFVFLGMLIPMAVSAQSIAFGDNASEWANDGECDDRRFAGAGMATGLDRDDIGHDATDCRNAFQDGRITVWDFVKARAATQCHAIRFGDDASEWSNDDLCDDFRFDGSASDAVILSEDIGHDATDCRRLCEAGQIALRDY
ncbi:MAG: hypothetical protein WBC93_02610 [Sulfitobacter sp.]